MKKIELTDAEVDALLDAQYPNGGVRSGMRQVVRALEPILASRGYGHVDEMLGPLTEAEKCRHFCRNYDSTIDLGTKQDFNRILAARHAKFAPKVDVAVEAVGEMLAEQEESPHSAYIHERAKALVALVRAKDKERPCPPAKS